MISDKLIFIMRKTSEEVKIKWNFNHLPRREEFIFDDKILYRVVGIVFKTSNNLIVCYIEKHSEYREWNELSK